jgi:pyruvate/2-oxoglutarate/acetoin dehydrogenase E1 component
MKTSSLDQTFAAAIDSATAEEMRRDASVFLMATSPPAQLLAEFGPARVRETPIAESAMVGMAIGAAASGLRPIVSLSCVNFSFVAFDQMVNQAARIRYMFGGQREFPIVFRARYLNGTRSAAQHSQTGYAYYAHAGGIKVVTPSCAADAKQLFKTAVRDPNPVMFFEADRLGGVSDSVSSDPDETLSFGTAATRRVGVDVTIVAIGFMVGEALAAAERLATAGISAEVIDPRTLVPLDTDAIKASVRRTGRLIVVDESMPACSMASEIITSIVEDPSAFDAMKAPPRRVCTTPTPVPFSSVLEDFVLPGQDKILEAGVSLMS